MDRNEGGEDADADADGEEEEVPVYLKWNDEEGLDEEKFAVLPNDWPYNTPYGVRHYCVWSRVRRARLQCLVDATCS